MSCSAGKPNFRLLDPNVGWDALDPNSSNLLGFGDPGGIYLAQTVAGAVDPTQLFQYLLPARLARGCAACEWYLLTPFPPESFLLRRDACQQQWKPLWPSCPPAPFKNPVAVASWRKRLAVADQGANKVLLWVESGARLATEIPVEKPGPLAFNPRGELLVTCETSNKVARYDLRGTFQGFLPADLPSPGALAVIAVDSSHATWVVLHDGNSWALWSLAEGQSQFAVATIAQLQSSFAPTGLLAVSDEGFTFDQDTRRGLSVATGFSWYGRPVSAADIVPYGLPARQKLGQLLTCALDSGIPRCQWHRVRLDADIPAGTTLCAAVASTEVISGASQGDPTRDPEWKNFPAGPPHPADWTSGPAGSVDFLIKQPPGRYLYFRLRFKGNGTATPVVRRVRIDFPRVTSLDHLPDVYRETAQAEDFTERFLSLFDAAIADVDGVIERYPALLDPSGVPAQLLPWLGGFFGIGFDPTWDAEKRRQILGAAAGLYNQRGTLQGLQQAINLVFGVTPAIEEMSSTGPWGALGSRKILRAEQSNPSGSQAAIGRNARLRATRLFGKNSSRFRLDHSGLGAAPLRSYGNPDQDPFSAGAYRFRVLVPTLPDMSPEQQTRLTNLIEAQKPAHTVASVRIGSSGFLLGELSAVGVDTGFVPLAAPVLGSAGNIRLNRNSIVWNGPSGRSGGAGVGEGSIVGTQTVRG